jgi:lyso-ornithine lipid O-acyltransferase
VRLRKFRRAVALGLVLAGCIVDFWFLRLRGRFSLDRRALWLQSSCRKMLACLEIESLVIGDPPAQGLVVSNHLSYLDIVVIAAAMPCFFVAKSEIAGWPVFGQAARAGGTIFLVRTSRASAGDVAREIERRLALPVAVLLFPEGTSTDGSRVLRFHSRLIDPAVVAAAPVTAAALRYSADGAEERELCWYGDAGFLPHLWKTLGRDGLRAEVRFGRPRVFGDRRTAARNTHDEVEAMRGEGAAHTWGRPV